MAKGNDFRVIAKVTRKSHYGNGKAIYAATASCPFRNCNPKLESGKQSAKGDAEKILKIKVAEHFKKDHKGDNPILVYR